MRTIHTDIGIDTPPAAVWPILADIDKWSEWNPFLKASGRLAVGERLKVEVKPPGAKPMTFRPKVVMVEPGQEFRWSGSLGLAGLFDGEHGFRVVGEDQGRCRFEHFETFRGLLAAPILWKIGASTRQGFEAMNRALKARAEGR